MKKSKRELINYHFILNLQKITFNNSHTQSHYRFALYRDIQKIEMNQTDFHFSNEFSFSGFQLYFSTYKKWNPRVILTLYSIEHQGQMETQIQIGQMVINTEQAIQDMKQNDKHKFTKKGTIGKYEIEYCLYISDSKNGVNHILEGEKMIKSKEKCKLKKINTIEWSQNVSRKSLINLSKKVSEKVSSVMRLELQKENDQEKIAQVSQFTTQKVKSTSRFRRTMSVQSDIEHNQKKQMEAQIININQKTNSFSYVKDGVFEQAFVPLPGEKQKIVVDNKQIKLTNQKFKNDGSKKIIILFGLNIKKLGTLIAILCISFILYMGITRQKIKQNKNQSKGKTKKSNKRQINSAQKRK